MMSSEIELAAIANALGGAQREGRGWRCRCPAHADISPSLSLNIGDGGTLLVTCWSGCHRIEILRAIRQVSGMGRSAIYRNTIPDYQKREKAKTKTKDWVLQLWNDAQELEAGSLAVRYLENRGVYLTEYPTALRFSMSCWNSERATCLPALLGRFDDPTGNLSTVHRTYLEEPGKKAALKSPKKLASSVAKGGAIRLGLPSEQLGIAEGIETALGCMYATSIPVWASYSSATLSQVVVPSSVKEVIIFSDNDRSGAGQRSAALLSSRLLNEGFSVKKLIPPEEGRDWLDILVS